MLSHGYGWHDLLRSRRRDGRSCWLQRLVRPGGYSSKPAHLGLNWSHRLRTQSKSEPLLQAMLQSWTLTAYSRAVFACDPTRASGLPEPERREHLWRPLPSNSAQLIYQRLSRREDGVSIPPRTLTTAVLNLRLHPAPYLTASPTRRTFNAQPQLRPARSPAQQEA